LTREPRHRRNIRNLREAIHQPGRAGPDGRSPNLVDRSARIHGTEVWKKKKENKFKSGEDWRSISVIEKEAAERGPEEMVTQKGTIGCLLKKINLQASELGGKRDECLQCDEKKNQ